MNFGIDEYQRKQLLAITTYWIARIPANEIRPLGKSVRSALDAGRKELNLPEPNNKNALSGLLVGGLIGLGARPVDDIELAFRLWLDGREPFIGLTQSAGLWEVFSVVGWIAADDTSLNSFIRLNAFLAYSLSFLAERFSRDAKRFFPAWKGLQKGPQKSKENRAKEKQSRRDLLHAAANDYRRTHPNAKNAEIAAFLSVRGFGTVSSITRFLAGNKKQYWNAMATAIKQ